jgi:hypothetical protein
MKLTTLPIIPLRKLPFKNRNLFTSFRCKLVVKLNSDTLDEFLYAFDGATLPLCVGELVIEMQ